MTVQVWHYTDLYRPRWVWQVMCPERGCVRWGTMPTPEDAQRRGEEVREIVAAG